MLVPLELIWNRPRASPWAAAGMEIPWLACVLKPRFWRAFSLFFVQSHIKRLWCTMSNDDMVEDGDGDETDIVVAPAPSPRPRRLALAHRRKPANASLTFPWARYVRRSRTPGEFESDDVDNASPSPAADMIASSQASSDATVAQSPPPSPVIKRHCGACFTQ